MAAKKIFLGNVTDEVWATDTAIICTDDKFVTVKIVISNPDVKVVDAVNGTEYVIIDPGTTDFTSFGAADNNIDTVFTMANGPGTGTGIIQSTVINLIYSIPRQIPGYAETKVYVGKGNKLTTVGAGTYTIMVGNN